MYWKLLFRRYELLLLCASVWVLSQVLKMRRKPGGQRECDGQWEVFVGVSKQTPANPL